MCRFSRLLIEHHSAGSILITRIARLAPISRIFAAEIDKQQLAGIVPIIITLPFNDNRSRRDLQLCKGAAGASIHRATREGARIAQLSGLLPAGACADPRCLSPLQLGLSSAVHHGRAGRVHPNCRVSVREHRARNAGP